MARFLKDKQKSKGAAPGSLIFIGRQKMENILIRIVRYNSDSIKEEELKSLSNIKEYISEDHVTWISVYGLHNTAVIEELGQVFDISPLVLEDILNTDERPKLNEDEKHISVILKSLTYNPDSRKAQIDQVSMILGQNYLITVQEADYKHFEDVSKRLHSGSTRIRSFSPDYLCYTLMDTLVDSYILNIETLGSAIEEQEKILLTSSKQVIEDIYHFKTELSYIRKNIRPSKEVIARFVASDSELINPRTFNYLRDLEGLITQALEAIEIYYTMVSDQQNIYNTNVNNNVNDVMKVLTVFSAIFIPLTFIAGIYGMNFSNMPELEYQYSYYILWGIMVTTAVVMLFYFKRKKWL